MNFRKNIPIFIGMIILYSQMSIAQYQKTNPFGDERLMIYLNSEKTHWIKFCSSFQLWSRVTENNPGSTVNDRLEEVTTDISLRRFRFSMQIKPADRLFAFIQLGVNNLNYLSSRGTSIHLLDIYTEYNFSRGLSIGGGKSAWDGLSRYTSTNSSKQMSYDLPFVAQPTLNGTDDLTRKLSMYVKGKIGQLDYRLVIAKPFSMQNSMSFDPNQVEGIANFTSDKANIQYSGYFKYEFWEQESNKTCSHVGTYLGSKKVLNLGIGFSHQQDALSSLEQGIIKYHDMNLIAVDLFLDLPSGLKKNALTLYTAFFKYDLGPKYIRLIGANNPTNGVDPNLASFNNKGNAFPVLGTGTTFLNQVGYLFSPMGPSKNRGQLQPYATVQYSHFTRLENPMVYYDIGINWFLQGHLSKCTLNAQNRPIFFGQGNELSVKNRKWMFVLQYQFRIQ